MAPLHYAAKFDHFLSLHCAVVEGRKGRDQILPPGNPIGNIFSLQEADFMKCYSRLDPSIPLVCVCGNHDIGNRPTVETIEGYRQEERVSQIRYYEYTVAHMRCEYL